MTISAVAGGGGGSGPFLMETASIDGISGEFTPVVVPQPHAVDLDDNGTLDFNFGENFVVYGMDYDGDGRADLWDEMLATGRARPLPF